MSVGQLGMGSKMSKAWVRRACVAKMSAMFTSPRRKNGAGSKLSMSPAQGVMDGTVGAGVPSFCEEWRMSSPRVLSVESSERGTWADVFSAILSVSEEDGDVGE